MWRKHGELVGTRRGLWGGQIPVLCLHYPYSRDEQPEFGFEWFCEKQTGEEREQQKAPCQYVLVVCSVFMLNGSLVPYIMLFGPRGGWHRHCCEICEWKELCACIWAQVSGFVMGSVSFWFGSRISLFRMLNCLKIYLAGILLNTCCVQLCPRQSLI